MKTPLHILKEVGITLTDFASQKDLEDTEATTLTLKPKGKYNSSEYDFDFAYTFSDDEEVKKTVQDLEEKVEE